MKKRHFIIFLTLLTFGYLPGFAQSGKAEVYKIEIVPAADGKKATVTANGKPFTELIFTDTLEKHFLYPIYAPSGEIITRGFPYAPRPNEATDHPHHVGLWLNYENVNGLDFWNNSYAIPAEKKDKYGSIKSGKIVKTKSGKKGELKVTATWVNNKNQVLLDENTTFFFKADADKRIIDRVTTLTAKVDVTMADVKDGMLGLRLGRELEMPSKKKQEFTDDKGNVTVVESSQSTASGNYITSEGKEGDDAWGTRSQWCMLYGKVGSDTTSVVIIDHPRNVGYPTYWHARGYGLFSANPLGQKAFSNGKEVLNFSLKQGQSVTFRYRVVVASGKQPLQKDEVNLLAGDFFQTVK
ncbi:MAG: PmoA family protein [Chitinophagaceae bacterium]|nr:PmoA family protein [Chitinophagaceae bacterium]MCW5928346.1 PmoA family protein [Chitinophagaceae bacterium]